MGWPRPFQSRSGRLAGILLVAIVIVIAAGYVLLPLAVEGLTATIDFTLNAGVWLATAAGSGEDVTTILVAVGREVVRTLATPRELVVITALVLVSAGALYGIQRVLGWEEESNAN